MKVSLNFGGILLPMFIAFKVFGVVSWSWFWVLSPMWLPIVFFLGMMVACFGFAALAALIDNRR